MEETHPVEKLTKPFVSSDNPKKMLLTVVSIAITLGIITGYILSSKNSGGTMQTAGLIGQSAKNAAVDTKTFRDFAEGTIKAKPEPEDGDYSEGTHTLVRQGADPVALTSSVVDLSVFEGKKVKVYGETQKALKSGWLMDVGKVEEVK